MNSARAAGFDELLRNQIIQRVYLIVESYVIQSNLY